MEFKIQKSFAKDLKKVKDKKLLNKVKNTIEEIRVDILTIENEDEIQFKVKNTKKITGSESAYRIKVDDSYRIGAEVDKAHDKETKKEKKTFSVVVRMILK